MRAGLSHASILGTSTDPCHLVDLPQSWRRRHCSVADARLFHSAHLCTWSAGTDSIPVAFRWILARPEDGGLFRDMRNPIAPGWPCRLRRNCSSTTRRARRTAQERSRFGFRTDERRLAIRHLHGEPQGAERECWAQGVGSVDRPQVGVLVNSCWLYKFPKNKPFHFLKAFNIFH